MVICQKDMCIYSIHERIMLSICKQKKKKRKADIILNFLILGLSLDILDKLISIDRQTETDRQIGR